MAGVNPVDHITVGGTQEIKPLPHIPGAETSGVVEEVGEHVMSLKRGDRVTLRAN
jgi:NADPH:quinone reductase-like Zn-dependent oxidoreductase